MAARRRRRAAQIVGLEQLRGGAGEQDAAILHHVGAMRDLQRHRHVLLDQQDGHPGPVQLRDEFEHLLDQQRAEAQRRLVEDQQHRLGHHGASDREHLLLSAGKRTGELARALLQAREELVHPRAVLLSTLSAASIGTEIEVLQHAEIREDPPPLGHLDQSRVDDRRRRGAADVAALEDDLAGCGGDDAGERPGEGRLAGAVRAEQCDHLPRHHVEIDAVQNGQPAVAADQATDAQHRNSGSACRAILSPAWRFAGGAAHRAPRPRSLRAAPCPR